MLQCNVPSWEYGKPLNQPLLPTHLCRRTHEDSAQLTNLRYRHHSGLYLSGNGDGSRCQRPVLCSHRWMTNTRSVRWMRWERPVSPRLQRRATIDPLSILCPSRGGSTSPERHLDSSSHCNSNQAASSSVGRLVTPRCIRRVVAGPGVLTELTLRRYHRYWSAARARLAGRGRLGWARLHWRVDCLRWRRITLAEVRILRFAICDELQIDLWQRAASPARLRHSPHDGRDAIHKKALAGPGTALHKSRLLASR